MRGTPSSHAEFVERTRQTPYWSVSDPRGAFRLAWGLPGELVFWVHHGICLATPLLWLGYACRSSQNPWLAAWAPLALWTALVSKRSAIGLLPGLGLALLVGVPLAFLFGADQLRAAAAPALAWLVAVSVRGLVAGAFVRRLVRSPESWKRVFEAGLVQEG